MFKTKCCTQSQIYMLNTCKLNNYCSHQKMSLTLNPSTCGSISFTLAAIRFCCLSVLLMVSIQRSNPSAMPWNSCVCTRASVSFWRRFPKRELSLSHCSWRSCSPLSMVSLGSPSVHMPPNDWPFSTHDEYTGARVLYSVFRLCKEACVQLTQDKKNWWLLTTYVKLYFYSEVKSTDTPNSK